MFTFSTTQIVDYFEFLINFYSYTPIKKHLNDRCNKYQNFASLGFTYTGFLRLYVLFEICLP